MRARMFWHLVALLVWLLDLALDLVAVAFVLAVLAEVLWWLK
jgi:hypothetical protein